jgi:D-glycero-D-manno-heptose 1,7-bisphosphate phosphatase
MGSDTNFRRAAFLDRDGVINVDLGYVARQEDFHFVPGVLDAARELARRGFALVVITNQSGIARGMYTEDDFHRLTRWMRERFAEAGAPLAGVYFCPHHPTEGQGRYRVNCTCRKPAPGMLLAAAHELGLALSRSVLFGDRRSDLEAAHAAGVPQRILLGTDGRGAPDDAEDGGLATARFGSLADAVGSPLLAHLLEEAARA